jgi:hypothetical protein
MSDPERDSFDASTRSALKELDSGIAKLRQQATEIGRAYLICEVQSSGHRRRARVAGAIDIFTHRRTLHRHSRAELCAALRDSCRHFADEARIGGCRHQGAATLAGTACCGSLEWVSIRHLRAHSPRLRICRTVTAAMRRAGCPCCVTALE